jgi:hypothetical protein
MSYYIKTKTIILVPSLLVTLRISLDICQHPFVPSCRPVCNRHVNSCELDRIKDGKHLQDVCPWSLGCGILMFVHGHLVVEYFVGLID